jgi:hypothetical protein
VKMTRGRNPQIYLCDALMELSVGVDLLRSYRMKRKLPRGLSNSLTAPTGFSAFVMAHFNTYYRVVFPAALAFFHLAIAAADMAARPAALIWRFFGAALVPAAFAFAQRIFRAFARALISLRRCAADSRRLGGLAEPGASVGLEAPTPASAVMASNWPSNDSICSLSAIARRKSATESSPSDFIGKRVPTESRKSNASFVLGTEGGGGGRRLIGALREILRDAFLPSENCQNGGSGTQGID